MGLFGSNSTTTTNAPWSKAQPYITAGMQSAQGLYKAGTGFNAPNFNTSVQMSDQTRAGLGNLWNVGAAGDPTAGASRDVVLSQLSGSGYGQLGQKGADLYNQGAGVNAGVAGQYASLADQASNPHFQQAVQNQSDQIANDVQRQFSGLGRYGSAANTQALTDQLGQFREKAMSDNWSQNLQNQMAALGGQAGLQQQGYANQQAALGQQAGLLGQQGQAQLAAVGAAPGVYQQMQAGGKLLGQVGAAYDDQATRDMQAKLDAYNATQQSGWNRLGAYNQAISGQGGGASGFGTQSVQNPNNLFGAALGGAIGGGKLGGQYGAVAGGLLGALSGW